MTLTARQRMAAILIVLAGLALLLNLACASLHHPAPPVARKIPKIDTLHGEVRVDNYFWMRDRNDTNVVAYLKAQNDYVKQVMKGTEKFEEDLYKEILGRIKETDMDVPYKLDDYYYYSRTEQGKQYSIHCRKKGSLEAPEEIILDENKLAEGRGYLGLGSLDISPDHNLLAYVIDTTGGERYTLYVKNLQTGQLFPDIIGNVSTSVVWANDNQTMFYTIRDEANRPYKLYRHKLGTSQDQDILVYHEPDEQFWMGIVKTRSRAYILIGLGSNNTTEYRYLDANNPTGEFKMIHPRQREMEYSVDHHGDYFYIVTNDNARNFKLMKTPVTKPAKENWVEVIGQRDSVKIDNIDLFTNHMVVYERERGLPTIQIVNLTTNDSHYIEFPEPVYNVSPGNNPDFNTNTLRYTYYSLITPNSVYDYNMDTRQRELKKQRVVLGGYDPSLYKSERIFAKSPDGVQIPISMVYKKDLMKKDGTNPLYLYVYGAYGNSMDPYFSSSRLSLLDRGFIYCIAHVRGGGEMGRWWYDDGKLLKKKNTFLDVITSAEDLIKEKYTSSDKLVVSGGSAGGLTVGAAMNMRPDLFKIVVADVPFVDIINTMMDPTLPLTVIEYDEWGNPNDSVYYAYMKSYSPYDNVEAKAYPNILITTSLNDPRVSYWEPAKWAAKLQEMKTDDNPVLLKTNMGAGHGGSSGRYDYLKDIAFEYAFILNTLGIKK